jgi:hypothetical protein
MKSQPIIIDYPSEFVKQQTAKDIEAIQAAYDLLKILQKKTPQGALPVYKENQHNKRA